jgi:hypothetical protein
MVILDIVSTEKSLPKALNIFKKCDNIEPILPFNYLAFYKYKKNVIIDHINKMIEHICMNISEIINSVESKSIHIYSDPIDINDKLFYMKDHLLISECSLCIDMSSKSGGELIDQLYKLMKMNLPGDNSEHLAELPLPIPLHVDKRTHLLKKLIKLPKIDLRNIEFDNDTYYMIRLNLIDNIKKQEDHINDIIKDLGDGGIKETIQPSKEFLRFFGERNQIRYDYTVVKNGKLLDDIKIKLTKKIQVLLKKTIFVTKLNEN